MNFTNFSIFIVLLIVILAIIYIGQKHLDHFDLNFHQSYQPVNYNTLEQDCNQLTWSPSKCTVSTVIPKDKNVCNGDLTPITNNQKECKKRKKDITKTHQIPTPIHQIPTPIRPTASLQYDFDLLSSFNNAQISNHDGLNNDNNDNTYNNNYNNIYDHELITDIRSLNSLENDLLSNY